MSAIYLNDLPLAGDVAGPQKVQHKLRTAPNVALSSELRDQKPREETGISSFSSVGPRKQLGRGGFPWVLRHSAPGASCPSRGAHPPTRQAKSPARSWGSPNSPQLRCSLVSGPSNAWRLHPSTSRGQPSRTHFVQNEDGAFSQLFPRPSVASAPCAFATTNGASLCCR